MTRSISAIYMGILDLLKYGFSVRPDGAIIAPAGVPHGACSHCTKEAQRTGKPCPCVLPKGLELVRAPSNISKAVAAESQGLYMRPACERCSQLKLNCSTCTSGEGSSFYWTGVQLPRGGNREVLVQVPKPDWRLKRAAAARAARARGKAAAQSTRTPTRTRKSHATDSSPPHVSSSEAPTTFTHGPRRSARLAASQIGSPDPMTTPAKETATQTTSIAPKATVPRPRTRRSFRLAAGDGLSPGSSPASSTAVPPCRPDSGNAIIKKTVVQLSPSSSQAQRYDSYAKRL